MTAANLGQMPTQTELVSRRLESHHAKYGPQLGCDEDNESFIPALTADGQGVYCETCSVLLYRDGGSR